MVIDGISLSRNSYPWCLQLYFVLESVQYLRNSNFSKRGDHGYPINARASCRVRLTLSLLSIVSRLVSLDTVA